MTMTLPIDGEHEPMVGGGQDREDLQNPEELQAWLNATRARLEHLSAAEEQRRQAVKPLTENGRRWGWIWAVVGAVVSVAVALAEFLRLRKRKDS